MLKSRALGQPEMIIRILETRNFAPIVSWSEILRTERPIIMMLMAKQEL